MNFVARQGARLGLPPRFLKLEASIKHFTAGEEFDRPEQAKQFLNDLPDVVRDFQGCDVVLYQAGADPHINDPLGGWLTDAQLALRDFLASEKDEALSSSLGLDGPG